MKNVAVVCFAVVFIGVALSVASLVTPYWTQNNFSFNSSNNAGLWKYCEHTHYYDYEYERCSTITGDYIEGAAWFYAVRAFAVASVLLSLPVLLLLAVNCERALGRGLRSSAAVLGIQALFYIISLAVYAAETQPEGFYSFGYSFILGWFAAAAFIAEAAVFLCLNRRLSMDGYNELP